MKFIVKKDEFLNGIRIVEHATTMKGLQPVLANIFVDTIDEKTLKLSATDLDLTITTQIQAQVQEEGQITLPAKKLSDIVSRLTDDLVEFNIDLDTNSANIQCKNSKFSVIGISANEFPALTEYDLTESIDIDIKTFSEGIRQVGYAAAGSEYNKVLSGIVFNISDNKLEMAATDGNRLARVRQELQKPSKDSQLIIPARALQEFMKITSLIEDETVHIYLDKTKLIFKTTDIMMISSIIDGQYPKYNQLIPETTPKEAIINVESLISALERVSIMINEKTNTVKMEFKENKLILSGNTDIGTSEDVIEIKYDGDDLKIAFNYKYVIDAIKNMTSSEILMGLNTSLSATVIKPNTEDDYISLIMPVQLRD